MGVRARGPVYREPRECRYSDLHLLRSQVDSRCSLASLGLRSADSRPVRCWPCVVIDSVRRTFSRSCHKQQGHRARQRGMNHTCGSVCLLIDWLRFSACWPASYHRSAVGVTSRRFAILHFSGTHYSRNPFCFLELCRATLSRAVSPKLICALLHHGQRLLSRRSARRYGPGKTKIYQRRSAHSSASRYPPPFTLSLSSPSLTLWPVLG